MRKPHHRQSKRLAKTSGITRRVGGIIGQPRRLGLAVAVGLFGLWLILTGSLPFALAPRDPDAALALDPDNPAALLSKAKTLRQRLADLSLSPAQKDADGGGNTALNGADAVDKEELRTAIGALAKRLISSDPLNAEAFRLLAEVTDSGARVRTLMTQSYLRSRHETYAVLWLLNDSYYRKDFNAALDYADVLLRTQWKLNQLVLNYMAGVARDPEGLPLLAGRLADNPRWRDLFFRAISMRTVPPETFALLQTRLQDSARPMTVKELGTYLDALVEARLFGFAYNIWLQSLAPEEAARVGLLNNGTFEHGVNRSPFDWRIGEGSHAIMEIVAPTTQETQGSVHLVFGDGRVQFPELSQIVILPPGHYRVSGDVRGSLAGKRGLQWRLDCLPERQRTLGETEMLLGEFPDWTGFSFEVNVLTDENCAAQSLRLFHDARSASEEFISGQIAFRSISITRSSSDIVHNPEARG